MSYFIFPSDKFELIPRNLFNRHLVGSFVCTCVLNNESQSKPIVMNLENTLQILICYKSFYFLHVFNNCYLVSVYNYLYSHFK